MNEEIGTVAKQFSEREYLFRIFSIGTLQCGEREGANDVEEEGGTGG